MSGCQHLHVIIRSLRLIARGPHWLIDYFLPRSSSYSECNVITSLWLLIVRAQKVNLKAFPLINHELLEFALVVVLCVGSCWHLLI